MAKQFASVFGFVPSKGNPEVRRIEQAVVDKRLSGLRKSVRRAFSGPRATIRTLREARRSQERFTHAQVLAQGFKFLTGERA